MTQSLGISTPRSSFRSVRKLIIFGSGSTWGGSYLFTCQIRSAALPERIAQIPSQTARCTGRAGTAGETASQRLARRRGETSRERLLPDIMLTRIPYDEPRQQ